MNKTFFFEDDYNLEQTEVYELLTMPITSAKYSRGKREITKNNNSIISTQTYYPNKNYKITLDSDMSDFAVGFYEIIYKDFLCGKPLLNENDDVFDHDFCGDTMNGFNYIANDVKGAGRSKENRTEKSNWPNWLQQYYDSYHCLSNFWLLPWEIGRSVSDPFFSKGSYIDYNICDYMDRFLEHYNRYFHQFQKNYSNYSKANESFKKFAENHFLTDVYLNENLKVKGFSDCRNPEKIVNEIIVRIHLRANAIIHSKYYEEIYNYFYNLGLISNK